MQAKIFKKLDDAYAYMQEHGGRIWAEQIAEKGARTYVVAPLWTLIKTYLNMRDKIGDEYYFANQRTRLFWDLDGKHMYVSTYLR